MDIFEAIEGRRSIRHYTKEAVSKEQLHKVLEAARLAPSWKNSQHWRYIVVSGRQNIMALGEAAGFNPNQQVYEDVPCFIVLCADEAHAEEWEGKQYYMCDMGIGMEHLVLAAQSLGLGTCWIGAFPERPIVELLGIPQGMRVVALTPLGVPARAPQPRPRKQLEEIVFGNAWGKPLGS